MEMKKHEGGCQKRCGDERKETTRKHQQIAQSLRLPAARPLRVHAHGLPIGCTHLQTRKVCVEVEGVRELGQHVTQQLAQVVGLVVEVVVVSEQDDRVQGRVTRLQEASYKNQQERRKKSKKRKERTALRALKVDSQWISSRRMR